ncbi:unnamed protein product [Ceratitis capitata]|uniref:(Mediterranean fruit fly) hypothetical protein n=1 Tax=Ceratitis capitata TaxID=7213 RepID=A0A811UPC5_CERCA|nr:unnamed protein product [Ceratitis capitata]
MCNKKLTLPTKIATKLYTCALQPLETGNAKLCVNFRMYLVKLNVLVSPTTLKSVKKTKKKIYKNLLKLISNSASVNSRTTNCAANSKKAENSIRHTENPHTTLSYITIASKFRQQGGK